MEFERFTLLFNEKQEQTASIALSSHEANAQWPEQVGQWPATPEDIQSISSPLREPTEPAEVPSPTQSISLSPRDNGKQFELELSSPRDDSSQGAESRYATPSRAPKGGKKTFLREPWIVYTTHAFEQDQTGKRKSMTPEYNENPHRAKKSKHEAFTVRVDSGEMLQDVRQPNIEQVETIARALQAQHDADQSPRADQKTPRGAGVGQEKMYNGFIHEFPSPIQYETFCEELPWEPQTPDLDVPMMDTTPPSDEPEPESESDSDSDTSSEVNIAIGTHFEPLQRPRAQVVPEYKWGYTVKYSQDANDQGIPDRTFTDRAKANEYVDKKTSADALPLGLDSIASRTTTLTGPSRLLKVDLVLTTGEHHLMWVTRDLVSLATLKEDKKKQLQWQAQPRRSIPHYVVTCDLLVFDRHRADHYAHAPMPRDEISASDGILDSRVCRAVKWGGGGTGVKTFTVRQMANRYAAQLFLDTTKVDPLTATAADVAWWMRNVVPIHERAESIACREVPEGGEPVDNDELEAGLYCASLTVSGLVGPRTGWDQIIVEVHEVDDIQGPVNF